jgi:SAM-dependent methyltransferase
MLPELYHAHHSRHMEDLPFWLNLAARQGSPLLELGCGTGRLLIPLAQAGFKTLGMDYDPDMLRYLKKNIPLAAGCEPLLILADISHFSLGKQFPLVILPCNTYSTLPEVSRRDCLRCVHQVLQPGGLFAASLPNPALLKSLPAHADIELEDEFSHPITGNPVQVSSAWQRTGKTFTVTWIYDHLFADGHVERHKQKASHYLIPVDEYAVEIQAAGMKIRAMYGDFDRSTYAADSPLLILLAESVC